MPMCVCVYLMGINVYNILVDGVVVLNTTITTRHCKVVIAAVLPITHHERPPFFFSSFSRLHKKHTSRQRTIYGLDMVVPTANCVCIVLLNRTLNRKMLKINGYFIYSPRLVVKQRSTATAGGS